MRHPTQARRFVVVACPRSGTGYASRLFTGLGLPCGHETIFHPAASFTQDASFPWPSHLTGDSSWLAAPFLRTLPPDVAVLHQVRSPLAVVRSLLRIRLFERRSPFRRFAERFCPRAAEGSLPERCLAFWLEWNRRIASAAVAPVRVHARYRVESLTSAVLSDLLGRLNASADPQRLNEVLEALPRDTNTRGDRRRDGAVSWDAIEDLELRAAAQELASTFGYPYSTPQKDR